MKKKIHVSKLKPGMFVEELDKPWIETPYLIEGLIIKSEEDIVELARHCKHVYISTDDSPPPAPPPKKKPITQYKLHIIPEDTGAKTAFHGKQVYVTKSLQEEMPLAKQAHEKALVLMDQIKAGIDKDFKLDIKAAKQLVDVIASSMIRNPEAMMLLNGVQAGNKDHFDHALQRATYMIGFGRHLCLPTDELTTLGLGGLLMDIGLLKVEEQEDETGKNLFHKDNAMRDEHVKFGEKMLSKMPGIPLQVIEITAQHHEREDGSGYPLGLTGNQISAYARMAGIVDSYERMVSKGIPPYVPPATPFEALKMLWDWTRNWLNATLVQQFAHCIGLFPVGSLVELNSGEVAVVLSHNRTKRLNPRVMVVLDNNKKPYQTPWSLDLASPEKSFRGLPYEIVSDLEAGAFGVNAKDYYL